MVHSPQLLMGTEHSSSAQLKSFPAYCSGTTRPGLQLSSTRINSPGKQPGNGHRAPGGAGHGCSPAGQASTSEIRCTPRAVSQQPSEKSTPHWQVLRNSLESSPCKPSGIHSSPQSHHSHPGCDSGSCEAELCCSHRTCAAHTEHASFLGSSFAASNSPRSSYRGTEPGTTAGMALHHKRAQAAREP